MFFFFCSDTHWLTNVRATRQDMLEDVRCLGGTRSGDVRASPLYPSLLAPRTHLPSLARGGWVFLASCRPPYPCAEHTSSRCCG